MNTIDWIIVLIILIFMLLGSLRGFVNSVIGLVEYALSIFLAWKLSPMFAKFMVERWAVDEKISSVIRAWIPNLAEKMINNSEEYSKMMEMSGQTMDDIKLAIAEMEIPFLDTLTDKLIQVLAIVILFIIIKFLFGIARFVLNRITRLPVLKTFNKVGGMIVGFIEGAIVAIVAVIVVSLLPNERLQTELDNSFIGYKVEEVVVNSILNIDEISELKFEF